MPNVVILNKLTWKGTLRQVFYLSEAPSTPKAPYFPLLTHCILVYRIACIYSHRKGGRAGGELTREKVRGAIVHKAGGGKYQHD
jgi:hypothetical protein